MITVACSIIAYWAVYTRRMKTPANVSKDEGIVMALREHHKVDDADATLAQTPEDRAA